MEQDVVQVHGPIELSSVSQDTQGVDIFRINKGKFIISFAKFNLDRIESSAEVGDLANSNLCPGVIPVVAAHGKQCETAPCPLVAGAGSKGSFGADLERNGSVVTPVGSAKIDAHRRIFCFCGRLGGDCHPESLVICRNDGLFCRSIGLGCCVLGLDGIQCKLIYNSAQVRTVF